MKFDIESGLYFRDKDAEYGEVSDDYSFMGNKWVYKKEKYSPKEYIKYLTSTDEYKAEMFYYVQSKVNKLDKKEYLSDGYHTFKELYDFRMVYNAALFNEWAKLPASMNEVCINYTRYSVHKSWKHYDGEWYFGKEKEWFIVSAKLPTGLISNHYKAEYWDMFKIPEVEKALFEFDGHSSQDVLERLKNL